MGDYSTFLFGRPSLVEGAARLFDFAGALSSYNTFSTGSTADERALHADWRAVGNDIAHAGQQYARFPRVDVFPEC